MTWAAHVGMLSGFKIYFNHLPRVVAALQPWAGISQRLRRYYAGLELANTFGVIKLTITDNARKARLIHVRAL